MYCVREAAKVIGLDTKGATMAIQGFGNAGQFAATLGKELLGAKIVAVSDSKGGIFDADGLDPDQVIAHKQQTGSVVGYDNAASVSNEELLELDVDIQAPAALENQITATNAASIKAKIIAELANGPTTPEADDVLHDNGVYVIPDFLCNAGGVTVSYFEQVQNAYDFYWDIELVHERLDKKMTTAFLAVDQTAKTYGINNRMAAYVVAVQRVAEACRLRGWV
jgi:glutamate dehydrogenase (NAD(P)+)